MNREISELLDKTPTEIQELFAKLESILRESVSEDIEEKLWAKLPSYYVGEKFVRMIPFKDHINIEARAISENSDLFQGFKITPKGMLQLYTKQEIPAEELKKVFYETLAENNGLTEYASSKASDFYR